MTQEAKLFIQQAFEDENQVLQYLASEAAPEEIV
jgi:hypothetical protein